MVSPGNIASPGMPAASVLNLARGQRIMFLSGLRRQLLSMPGRMLFFLEVQAGVKPLHLPLSLCTSSGHIAQHQWLRLVEKVSIKLYVSLLLARS
jgi:hypothetical protein